MKTTIFHSTKTVLLLFLMIIGGSVYAQDKIIIKNQTGDKLKRTPKSDKKGPILDKKWEVGTGKLNTQVNNQRFYRANPLVTEIKGTKITTYIEPADSANPIKRTNKNKAKESAPYEKDGRICTPYSVSLNLESESFDAPLADKMSYTYPGAAYSYNEYIKNNTQPSNNKSPRHPIILQASSSSATGKQILVENPTKNNLDQAVGELKYSLPKEVNNLSTEIYVQSIVNEATFALNMEAGGGGYGAKASAKFGLNYDSKKTYMSIDAKQKNYVLTANLPDDAAGGFFKDEAENAKYDNVFMSSVTYGRRVIGVIETELETKTMEVGAKASYEGFGVSANLGLNILDKMNSEKTKVRLLYIGGNGSVIDVPNPVTAASVLAAINKWLNTASAQAAVPIEYTFRNMQNKPMRWESVTNNIAYEQCVAKAEAYNISITLTSIGNNKKENAKLGISQSVGINVNGQWKNENSGLDKPIICWMEGWKGCQTPPDIDFRNDHVLNGLTRKYTITSDEYEQNPLLRIQTDRIVTYRTSVGGSKNEENRKQIYEKRLKDVGNGTFDVPVHINGRIFTFKYKVEINQNTATK